MAAAEKLTKPLENRMFRMLWASVLISNVGSMIQSVSAGWLMATITESEDLVALVQTATNLPVMLFSLLAGALADNYDRRRQMFVAQTFMLIVSIALTAVTIAGGISPALLLTGTFVLGCGTALSIPAWQASLRDLVGREDLPSAVTLNSMSYNFTRSVGPAVGGILVASFGAAVAFAVNVVSYGPILFSLRRWRKTSGGSDFPREPLGQAIGAGIRYVAMSPHLLQVIVRSFLFSFSGVAVMAMLPLLTRDTLALGATAYGLLFGSFGFGAVIGAMYSARLRIWLSNERLARYCSLGFAASIALIGGARLIWVAVLCLPIAGACWVLTISLFNTTVQMWTPRWVVGRCMSIYQTAVFGGMALGSWVWGVIALRSDAPMALLFASATVVISVMLGMRYPLPPDLFMDLSPLGGFKVPNLGLDPAIREGPVFVAVEYQIDECDVPAFLEMMQQRRRIRIRDGARRWSILQDLQQPGQWTETYYVPTWIEYIRHHGRRTNADASIGKAILEFHRGNSPPKVRRMIERQTLSRHDDWQGKPGWEV